MSRLVDDLEPATRARCKALLTLLAARGLEVMLLDTLRTAQEQNALYAQGRTIPGRIVTKARAGFSWHNFGRAFDLCFLEAGRAVWSGPWSEVGPAGEALGLEWGGRWTFRDEGHFEYHPGLTLEEARAAATLEC